jgi:NADPH:quinone reductase-like Zn-dependent oxidoreductase
MFLMSSNGTQLAALADLYTQNKIQAVIDRSYGFTESIEALEYLSRGRAKGKVVITH